VKVKRPSRPVDQAEWQRHINVRLRAEFMAGAEEERRKHTGRPMTAAELRRVLRSYPGDLYGGQAQRVPKPFFVARCAHSVGERRPCDRARGLSPCNRYRGPLIAFPVRAIRDSRRSTILANNPGETSTPTEWSWGSVVVRGPR
jgi:hypothetical protein